MSDRLVTRDVELLLKDAITIGLAKGDPGMVKQVLEIQHNEDMAESFTNFTLNIVPFTVPDPSLREIVLKCPPDILEEIMEAMIERKRLENSGVEAAENHEGKIVKPDDDTALIVP